MLFALPLILFAACSVKPRSEKNVIPDVLGDSEGLWLYKGNKRSRTNGTEEEKLLTSLTVGDEVYGEEDFKIISYMYVKDTCEIFYVVQIDTDCRLCHYNYMTKESSDLYDLPDTSTPENYFIEVSDSLVYVAKRVIFSHNAELMGEYSYGTLDGNIVYHFAGKKFEYVMNGEKHLVELSASFASSEYHRYGNYVYLLDDVGCAINLDTAECTTLSVFGTSRDRYRQIDDFYYTDGSLFVLSHCYPKSSYGFLEERLYQLIRITGASASVAYDFGNAIYGVTMSVDGSTLYFVKGGKRRIQNEYYAYDGKTETMKRVSAKTVKKGKTTADLEKAEKKNDNDKKLSVGDYTFYVNSTGYDNVSDAFGSHYSKTCYYLMRQYGDKKEVMQYSLNKNRGYFFDDICEF